MLCGNVNRKHPTTTNTFLGLSSREPKLCPGRVASASNLAALNCHTSGSQPSIRANLLDRQYWGSEVAQGVGER